MAKCGLVDCSKTATGGFQELINAGGGETIEGLKTAWCAEHENMLRPTVAGKRGKWLTAEQLA